MTIYPDVANLPEFQIDWQQLQTLVNELPDITITQYVNAKNLACPMPLLKLKMALKNTNMNHAVYVTTTDPNSQHDIGAFCRHMNYNLLIFIENTHDSLRSDNANDTIFHLLICKNN